MTVDTAQDRLAWLADAASSGQIHTVRVSWSDRLGAWRGKRLPTETFLASPERRISFCNGMIVVDVNCDIIQTTPFSNFETGYPDMYLRPRLDTLRPVGWCDGEAFVLGTLENHEGERLGVAPRNVLSAVVARLEQTGVGLRARLTLCGRLMRVPGESVALLPDGRGREEEHPGALRLAAEGLLRSGVPVQSIDAGRDGRFRLAIGSLAAEEAAEQAVIAKAALKEVARRRDLNAVFMTVLPDAAAPSELRMDLDLNGGAKVDLDRLRCARAALRGLLQPSINAFKAGELSAPTITGAGDEVNVSNLRPASEADPVTALAAEATAIGVALNSSVSIGTVSPANLADAATVLAESEWAADWLGAEFLENAVPLLRHEVALFASAVTDWELDRYWTAG